VIGNLCDGDSPWSIQSRSTPWAVQLGRWVDLACSTVTPSSCYVLPSASRAFRGDWPSPISGQPFSTSFGRQESGCVRALSRCRATDGSRSDRDMFRLNSRCSARKACFVCRSRSIYRRVRRWASSWLVLGVHPLGGSESRCLSRRRSHVKGRLQGIRRLIAKA
jgi:hypothetical protein